MTTLVWKLMDPQRSSAKGEKKVTRRMRASCDRCHHAKTKCIYEESHQDCVRCRARNLYCQRSLSMPRRRTPKPPREPLATPEEYHSPPSSQDAHSTTRTSLESSPDQYMPPGAPLLDFAQFTDFGSSFSPVNVGFFGAATLHTDPPGQEPPVNVLASPLSMETPRSRGEVPKHDCSAFQGSSSCLEVLNRTLRDLQQSPVEGKTLDHVLRLNRALMNVIRNVIECDELHHPSFDFTVYFCLNKLITTYHEALYMPCQSSVQFGSYIVNVEDQLALKCQMILIDIRKITTLLDQLQAKARQREEDQLDQAMGRTGGRCRRQCQFLHRFAKNEVDRVTKHIRLLGG